MKYIVVDLTCRTYPYDVHLYEALKRQCDEGRLIISGCLEEQRTDHYRCFKEGFVDVASQVPLGSLDVRRYLKAVEYIVNVLLLLLRVYRRRPDVLHVQWLPLVEVWPDFSIWWLKQIQNWGTSVVYTVHNVLPHDTGKRYKNNFQNVYQIADALVCHTEESRSQIVRSFGIPPGKISLIPHGPLSDEITCVPQKESRTQLGLDLKTPLCLLFGFMRPYKGVEFLLDSWKLVKKRAPSACLMLAGQPEPGYKDVLEEKIEKLGLEREVDARFEFLPQEELNLCIQAADILVYPYRSITQSGALLTGLKAGKPIVASSVGGFNEMIQHEQTGVLIEYGNEEQLAKELVDLLRDPERREQLGHAAQEMVETEYSWEAIAHKTLECYQSVVNSRQ